MRLEGFVPRLLAALASVCLLALMLAVVVDVGGRTLLSMPLRGATEVQEILLGAMVFLAYPLLALREKHITVDLVPSGPRTERVQRALSGAIGGALFAVIAWRLWIQQGRVAQYGETTGVLGIPLWPVLAGLAGLAVVVAICFFISAARALRGRAPPSAWEPER
jgi:TRAP-type C4-dicarboxylate transport system permease small subunit